MATLRFFYNGIKDQSGTLQKCYYSMFQLINYPLGTITIYGRDYRGFSSAVHTAFEVHNDSDMMTDYFTCDTIRVVPSHALYAEVLVAARKSDMHRENVANRRKEVR